jgi:hypothetical protein
MGRWDVRHILTLCRQGLFNSTASPAPTQRHRQWAWFKNGWLWVALPRAACGTGGRKGRGVAGQLVKIGEEVVGAGSSRVLDDRTGADDAFGQVLDRRVEAVGVVAELVSQGRFSLPTIELFKLPATRETREHPPMEAAGWAAHNLASELPRGKLRLP